jgi:hypothetical protein
MAIVNWVTKKGDLGTIPESQFFSLHLEATEISDQPLIYSFISGELPGGMYVTRGGELRGAPTILSSIDQIKTYAFTVRASNPDGLVADRSFSITVSNTVGPVITPRPDLIGAFFDGEFLSYQFESTNDNPSAQTYWTLLNGDLPPGTTLSTTGLLSGYVDIIAANVDDLGFEAAGVESVIFDALPESTDRAYNFTIQVTDGAKFNTLQCRALIVSKANFTADNDITVVNNTFITIDHDNSYRPIILNAPDSLPMRVVGDTFAYKFLAYDPEEQLIQWRVDELLFSGLDELDYPVNQTLNGDGTSGPYTMDRAVSADNISVRINDTIYYHTTDYTTSGTDLTFTSLTPGAADVIEILYIASGTGFDSLLWDQGAEGLPSGLVIDRDTGWLFGTLPEQVPDIETYELAVIAYRKLTPGVASNPVIFNLNVKRTRNEEIVWMTPTDLGQMDNGGVSEIAIQAYNTLDKPLDYEITYQPYRKIPQGLKMLPSGEFIGRVTFRYFSLDGETGFLPVTSTENLEVGMSIQGVGVAAGCEIKSIINSNTIEVQPAIYVVQGTPLTFTSDTDTYIVTTSANAISTAIDSGDTTFDQDCRFSVKATARDGSISSTKSFKIHINPRNLAPYENLYLKALPKYSQRLQLENLLHNESYVPPSLLYRSDDPNFGIQTGLNLLFLPGLSPAQASEMMTAISLNHYTKTINFGNIKTAKSINENGTVEYEIVYAEVIDNQQFGGNSPPLSTSLSSKISNKFIDSAGNEYDTIYTNSFYNMQRRLETGIGYTNRGALPGWMTSVQSNGRVLGLIRAVPLVYTKPGGSELIAYRLRNSGFSLNSIHFVADRYQWDNVLSKFFDPATNRFLPSRDTTFDKYPNLGVGSDVIQATVLGTVTNSNSIVTSDNLNVGYGWIFTGVDTNSTIEENVYVTSVTGTTVSGQPAIDLTLSGNVSATSGAVVKFDGTARVDYAVSTSFNRIDSELLSKVKSEGYVDGVTSLVPLEKLIFANQFGFDFETVNDGWVKGDGTFIYGYLEKSVGLASVNQRGGVWEINWRTLPSLGFDDDSVGFDEESIGLQHSRFDQGGDYEVFLTFVQEVNVSQTVYVRSGKSFPASTLQYRFNVGESTPRYRIFTGSLAANETTFDGGSCGCREGDPSTGGVRGGTAFSNNRDKFVEPGTEDKYIKFPKNGVFV